MGKTYGTGDGSTTFDLPDLRGRVVAGKDDMGGSAAGVLTSAGNGFGAQGQDPTVLGAKGGAQNESLGTANLLPYTPSGSITNGAISATVSGVSALPDWDLKQLARVVRRRF
ncbi:tail fiber protein [Bradyrhizobium sp. S3.9.1]|uniref:tail fiber protein n=1 Tax=Bradyrhizobium sp. S3.9.1 TaxID=3156431 RepID=UPI0033959395